MKKVFAWLLAVMMVCLMVPAMAETAVDSLLGTWYAVEMSQGEMKMDPSAMGLEIALTLNEDGTFALSTNGDSLEGTWEQTEQGFVLNAVAADSQQAESMEVLYTEGKLITEESGATVVFARELNAAFEPAAEVAAESEEAFFGTYSLDMIGMIGGDEALYMPASALGQSSTATIEAGKVTLETSAIDQNQESSTFGQPVSETATSDTPFADGQLKFVDNSSIMEIKSIIVLLEDGSLMITQESDPEAEIVLAMPMYYTRVE